MRILGLLERVHAALWVARVLLRTEIGRTGETFVAIAGTNGRLVIRRRGGWDAYDWPEDFEE